jgi:hypothetical protein
LGLCLTISLAFQESTRTIHTSNTELSTKRVKGRFQGDSYRRWSIIISSPMLLATREFLNLNITSKVNTNPKQLMINYHFGNKNSTILFLPINQMNATNHNSNRKWGGQEPNARVEFSPRDQKEQYYLGRPMDDVRKVSQYKREAASYMEDMLNYRLLLRFCSRSTPQWSWM